LGNEVLYNIENVLSMAQILQETNYPDIAVRVQKALDEAKNEAAGKSCTRPLVI
jgi:hypothetical protein